METQSFNLRTEYVVLIDGVVKLQEGRYYFLQFPTLDKLKKWVKKNDIHSDAIGEAEDCLGVNCFAIDDEEQTHKWFMTF
jgi:hypothetical protein